MLLTLSKVAEERIVEELNSSATVTTNNLDNDEEEDSPITSGLSDTETDDTTKLASEKPRLLLDLDAIEPVS